MTFVDGNAAATLRPRANDGVACGAEELAIEADAPNNGTVQQASQDPALEDTTRKSYVLLSTDGAQAGCSAAGRRVRLRPADAWLNVLWLLALALCALARPALAQPATDVERPRVIGDTSVGYPEDARGDATVVLELVIADDGEVRDVTVISGEAPFSEVAARSAFRWRFEPARRGGKPLASRIRFEVRFTEPPPAPPAPEEGAKTEAAAPAGPGKPAPRAEEQLEVTVHGDKRAPTVRSFTRAEVRELPGAFGDPFRAVEAMPGVTPIISGIPFFFMRGAPPGNVGYFLDGIRVPLLYHVGLGPSVIHPGIVERVDLYPGGYPARYGRFAGGIVAGETTPPMPDFHGEASVRLLDAGALVEAPFDGGRGTALVAGRYSYTGLLLSLLSPDSVLEYWDYQGRASYDVGARDTLTVFSFGAFDFIGEKKDGEVRTALGTEFHRVDLRWDHRASPRTETRLALTAGFDRTRGGERDFFVRDRLLSLRSEVRHRPSRDVAVRAGTDVAVDVYDAKAPRFDPEDPEDRATFERSFPTRTDLALGAYGDVTLEAAPGVSVTPGLRLDLYASNGAALVGIDPRISARFEITPKLRLIHAVGIAHQPPAFEVPVPGFQPAGLRGGLQESLQSSAGVEQDLPEGFKGSLTLFQNVFLDMTDGIGANQLGEKGDSDRFERRSLGSAVGAEIMVRRPLTHRLGGHLAYTLSRSTRSLGRERFPSAFDRTHVLNLALTYDLGRRWRAGTRLVYYSGFPAEEGGSERLRSESPRRVPAFYRLDVRLEKRWRLGERGYWAFVLEVLNATLSKETVGLNCDSSGECRADEIGPVTIPSVGVEASF
ncbi:MAG: TonB-dependent receptor [Polyangiaceae bacterium]|nr:TonB-dependent receptor [Polyangiaceae bacterium]